MKGQPPKHFLISAGLLIILSLYVWHHHSLKTNKRGSSYTDNGTGSVQRSIKTTVKILGYVENVKKPDSARMTENVWQAVEENGESQEIFLYSAYYDDRDAIEHHTVRVMGIIESEPLSLYCILWYTAGDSIYVNGERSKAGEWYLRHGKKFQGEVFSCGVPKDRSVPEFVSVVKSVKASPSTYLKVQIPEKPKDVLNIGVCITKPYGAIKPVQLIEWMEALKMWGVNEVTMYNNTVEDDTRRIIESYIDSKEMVLKSVPNVMEDSGEETVLLSMAPILNDCMYRNLHRYRALLSMDIGDLIVPKMAYDYLEMLNDIHRMQPSKHPATSYLFRNTYFFLDLPPVYKSPQFALTQKYVYRATADDFGTSGRSIISPLTCVILHEHLCWKVVPKFNIPGWLIDVRMDIATSHRYENCKLDDFYNEPGLCENLTSTIYKDESMLNFAEALIEKMSQVFFRMDMEYLIFGGTPDGDSELMGNTAADFHSSSTHNQEGSTKRNQTASAETEQHIRNEDRDQLETILDSMGKDKTKIVAMLEKLEMKKGQEAIKTTMTTFNVSLKKGDNTEHKDLSEVGVKSLAVNTESRALNNVTDTNSFSNKKMLNNIKNTNLIISKANNDNPTVALSTETVNVISSGNNAAPYINKDNLAKEKVNIGLPNSPPQITNPTLRADGPRRLVPLNIKPIVGVNKETLITNDNQYSRKVNTSRTNIPSNHSTDPDIARFASNDKKPQVPHAKSDLRLHRFHASKRSFDPSKNPQKTSTIIEKDGVNVFQQKNVDITSGKNDIRQNADPYINKENLLRGKLNIGLPNNLKMTKPTVQEDSPGKDTLNIRSSVSVNKGTVVTNGNQFKKRVRQSGTNLPSNHSTDLGMTRSTPNNKISQILHAKFDLRLPKRGKAVQLVSKFHASGKGTDFDLSKKPKKSSTLIGKNVINVFDHKVYLQASKVGSKQNPFKNKKNVVYTANTMKMHLEA